MDNQERNALFDQWAKSYDSNVLASDEEFPFAGYEGILEKVVTLADVQTKTRVLDLGTGTGNLAARFVAQGCDVWGCDFSSEMLKLAGQKVPQVQFVQANLLEGWPATLPTRFERVVSAYVFHEFDLENKVRLLREIRDQHLSEDGYIVIADVAFPTREARAAAQQRWAEEWDESEYYWAADEAIAQLERAELHASYTQISTCGGIFVIA